MLNSTVTYFESEPKRKLILCNEPVLIRNQNLKLDGKILRKSDRMILSLKDTNKNVEESCMDQRQIVK